MSRFRSLLCLLLVACPPVLANFDVAAELYRQKNYVSAHQAFALEASQGDPRAQTILALMFKYGEGTPQDFELAFKWYARAAEQGYPPGLFHAGSMLAEGLGVEPDRERAIRYLNLAADKGFTQANSKLAELNASTVVSQANDKLIVWSQDWDFSLPASYRLGVTEPVSTPSAPRYLAQIGAMGSEAATNRLWFMLNKQHPGLFGGLTFEIRHPDRGDRQIFRLYTGPFETIQSATVFCAQLLKQQFQAGCLPIQRTTVP